MFRSLSLSHTHTRTHTHTLTHSPKLQAGIWMNSGDQAGSVMAALVWILMLYSAITVNALTITEGIPPILGMVYTLLVSLALSCHAKTSLTDPGSVPKNAVPLESQRRDSSSHAMCGQCQTFKPPMSHHCRICNRCVSRMDHHCPWMNNCVGAANLSKWDTLIHAYIHVHAYIYIYTYTYIYIYMYTNDSKGEISNRLFFF